MKKIKKKSISKRRVLFRSVLIYIHIYNRTSLSRLKKALRGLFIAPYSSLKHSICLTLPNNKDAYCYVYLCVIHTHTDIHTRIHAYPYTLTQTDRHPCVHNTNVHPSLLPSLFVLAIVVDGVTTPRRRVLSRLSWSNSLAVDIFSPPRTPLRTPFGSHNLNPASLFFTFALRYAQEGRVTLINFTQKISIKRIPPPPREETQLERPYLRDLRDSYHDARFLQARGFIRI